MKKINDPDFFVVGLQKSGSYWVTALLNAHPEIRCFPDLCGGQTGVCEGRIFDMLASINKDDGRAFKNSFLNHHNDFYADLVPLLNKINQQELFNKFRDRYREWCDKHSEGKKIVGDKTTEYVFHLDMIDDFYPRVKKICILRDPKDRIVSWNFHQIRKGRKKEEKISNKFVMDYCTNRIKKEYESMLKYNGYIHCLTYEMLKNNPNKVINNLLNYLEVKTNNKLISNMIEAASIDSCRKKDKSISKEDKKEIINNEMRKSHYRKGVVGDWKNYLTDKQVQIVDDILSSLEKKVFIKYKI
ncbi:sulfotransferase [Candidatus Parcubacteria bacterium]|nr:sulfotransferase [Candidatus Parcubacteria bacterium]